MLGKLLRKYRWSRFRAREGYPCAEEVRHIGAWDDLCRKTMLLPLTEARPQTEDGNRLGTSRARRRHIDMAAHYSVGMSLEELAEHYNVTRERVRQCINKYYRDKTRETGG
jgi:hypothetical protein